MEKKTIRYRITTSLLNSWQRIWDCEKYVHENDNGECFLANDTEKENPVSYETKLDEVREKAKNDFINDLKRIKKPDNEAMRKGREYEDMVYSGMDLEFSPIVKNGAFQVIATEDVDIEGVPLRLYGILDVLKCGRIMDIKRVGYYQFPKYKTSHQHAMYLRLVPEAIDFTYLICDDKGNHHYERYLRENTEDIIKVISQFILWLKANDLFDIFIQNWIAY